MGIKKNSMERALFLGNPGSTGIVAGNLEHGYFRKRLGAAGGIQIQTVVFL